MINNPTGGLSTVHLYRDIYMHCIHCIYIYMPMKQEIQLIAMTNQQSTPTFDDDGRYVIWRQKL